MNPATVAKAVTAGVTAAGAALTSALVDGHVSAGEVVTIVTAGIVAALAVWRVPNKPVGDG